MLNHHAESNTYCSCFVRIAKREFLMERGNKVQREAGSSYAFNQMLCVTPHGQILRWMLLEGSWALRKALGLPHG